MPTILDVNFGSEFFGWPEALKKKGRKIRYQNSPSKFAEKFAGNFPKICWAKIKNHPRSALHNVGTKIFLAFLCVFALLSRKLLGVRQKEKSFFFCFLFFAKKQGLEGRGFGRKPGDHPNFRKNSLGVGGSFSGLWESSGVFSEQLSEFRN